MKFVQVVDTETIQDQDLPVLSTSDNCMTVSVVTRRGRLSDYRPGLSNGKSVTHKHDYIVLGHVNFMKNVI